MSAGKVKGRSVKDIPPERLAQLNAGAEAATLTECLAVDFAALMRNVLPEIGDNALAEMGDNASTGILSAHVDRDGCDREPAGPRP